MPCYRPITAWKPDDGGSIIFSEKRGHTEIKIPCGGCIGCRIRKREEWAVRCYAESKMHRFNHFVTLTYDDDHLPDDYSLHYEHVQLFHKSLRQKFGSFRFFTAGEYGDATFRPHYHSLYFGLHIPDLVKCNSMYSDFDLYESECLSALWKRGGVRVGAVTYESARYCAVYTTKKIGGSMAEEHYTRVHPRTGEVVKCVPEFAHMSLRPGIGMRWLAKYWRDIYMTGHDAVIINGSKKVVPKYFDQKLEELAPLLIDSVKFDRYIGGLKNIEDTSFARLEVRERVALAREKFNKERKVSNDL